MTQLLQHAFQLVSELPEDEQDKFARLILAELESERRWSELFERSDSEDLLEGLADEASAGHQAGRTRPLDAEALCVCDRSHRGASGMHTGDYRPACSGRARV